MLPTPPPALGPLARRPAVSVAALLVVGILLHDHLSAGWTLVAAAASVVAAIAVVRRRVVASALLAVAVLMVGAGLAQREHFAYPTADIGLFAADDARLATVEGRIADEPQLIAGADVGGRPFPPRQTFVADVTRVLTGDGWVTATGQLPVRLNGPNPALAAGDTVRLLGQLERPRPAQNLGEFDWAVYYRRLRVTATLTVAHGDNATVIAGPGFAPLAWARGKVRHALAAGFAADRADDFAVLQALLLGDRDPQLREIAADFQTTGVAYQLSVSGLHVALLAGGVVWGCRRLRLQPRTTMAVGLAFTLAYAAVAAPSHSGWRSVIVAAALAVGLFFRRDADRPQLVAVALIAMLAVHPLDLYTDGFQLSFAVVVAFLILLPALRRWWRRAEVDAPGVKRPRLTALGHVLKFVASTAQYATIAWMATVPLTASAFGRVAPWAVLTDLAIYPLVVAALFGGAAKVVLTLLWPSAAHPLAVVADGPVAAMRWVTHGCAALPAGSLSASAPPAWVVGLYYGTLLVPLLPIARWRWAWRAGPVVGLAGLLSVSLTPRPSTPASTPASTAGPALRVALLSVGAGQCGVVELPDGRAVMIDAGSSTIPEVAGRVVRPYLRSHGLLRLADVFLSHGDFDHVSAAADLAAAYGPEAVFTSHHFRRHAVGNEPDLDLLAKLDDLHRSPRELAAGDRVDLCPGVAVDVLWPPPGGAWTSNDAGLVLRLSYAGRRVLFPADIQDPAFAELLKRPEALAADVLVAPHHGSGETLTPAFVAAVHPSVIVASSAARLTAKQRRFDQIVGGQVVRTAANGAVTVTVTPDGRVGVGTYLQKAADRR